MSQCRSRRTQEERTREEEREKQETSNIGCMVEIRRLRCVGGERYVLHARDFSSSFCCCSCLAHLMMDSFCGRSARSSLEAYSELDCFSYQEYEYELDICFFLRRLLVSGGRRRKYECLGRASERERECLYRHLADDSRTSQNVFSVFFLLLRLVLGERCRESAGKKKVSVSFFLSHIQ